MNLTITPVKINTQNNSMKNKENPAFGSFYYENKNSSLLNYSFVKIFKSGFANSIVNHLPDFLKPKVTISQSSVIIPGAANPIDSNLNVLTAIQKVLTANGTKFKFKKVFEDLPESVHLSLSDGRKIHYVRDEHSIGNISIFNSKKGESLKIVLDHPKLTDKFIETKELIQAKAKNN